MLEQLLDAVDTLLDSSTLFIESHVSFPWVMLPLLTSPLIATPTVIPGLVYSTMFDTTADALNQPCAF